MQEFQAKIIGPTGDCAVLQITGDLDAYTAPALRQRMLDLGDDGVVHVIADMRQVDFLDSSGLRSILTVKALCEERSCRFSMTHGSGQAERLFELTRLVERLPFRKSGATRQRREIRLEEQPAGGEQAGPGALA